MIHAKKVYALGQYYIKVKFDRNPTLDNAMNTVKGAKYNPNTGLWSVPYQNRVDFETKMGDYLVVWEGDEVEVYAGGINEDEIPDQPIIPGYSIEYDENKNIIGATGFKTKPWGEYQVKGFNVLVDRKFLILADDAGLGKSWQTATAMEARKNRGDLNRGLILCKASLVYNWRDEIHMHTNCKAVVMAGTPKQRYKLYDWLIKNDDWTFLIMSYEIYRGDVPCVQLLDTYKPLDFCVIDEAQKVKSPESRIGTVIHYIPYRFRYVLTATPLINTPLEAFNYLKWGKIFRDDFTWWDFKKRYAVWGGRDNKEILHYKNMKELRDVIQKNMLRRLKKDKLKELPDIVFKTIRIEMSPTQQRLYRAVKKEIEEDLKDTTLEKVPAQLAKLIRLQQIVDSPALIGNDGDSTKLEALDDLLEELIGSGQKVIVFSRFKELINILQERYKMYNPATITGDVAASGKTEAAALRILKKRPNWSSLPESEKRKLIDMEMTSERQLQVYKFQNDSSCRLFLGTSGACREGLTLTAATHVVFVDCEWSPAYVEQAYSRAHRIGQKNAVTVYYLVCANTIDEHVQKVLARKESMVQAMIEDSRVITELGQQRVRRMIAEMIGEELK